MKVSKFQSERERLQRENEELKMFLAGLDELQDEGNFTGLVNMLAGIATDSISNQQSLLDQREAEATEAARPTPLDIWTMQAPTTENIGGVEYEDLVPVPGFTGGSAAILEAYMRGEIMRISTEQAENTPEVLPEEKAATEARTRKIFGQLIPNSTRSDIDRVMSGNDRLENDIFNS